jgi:nitric oxide reductase subunit B
MWYARSPEFMQTDTTQTLRWLRMIGDSLFALGGLAFGWFVLGLKTDWSLAPSERDQEQAAPAAGPAGAEPEVVGALAPRATVGGEIA